MKAYYDRMKETREDKDESQREIAKVLGIRQEQYGRYERGINEMPIRYLVAFCEHYKVSADYILGLPAGLERPR